MFQLCFKMSHGFVTSHFMMFFFIFKNIFIRIRIAGGN